MTKRAKKTTSPRAPSLHSLLRKELKIRFNKEIQIGRISLIVVTEPRECEGVCTPETEEEYQAAAGPPSPDWFNRLYCNRRIMPRGTIAIHQTLSENSGFEVGIDQTCCLECAAKAGVVLSASSNRGPQPQFSAD